MSLAGATGLIGTAVGLGVLVGVAGLAFQAVEKTFPDNRSRGRSRSRNGSGRRRQQDNIFDLGLTQQPRRSSKKKFRNENFGSDFNIFAI